MITFTGVLLTLFATVWINYRTGRRETAFRWAESKKQLYTGFAQACHDLRRVHVWPADTDPRAALDAIRLLEVEFQITAPAKVAQKTAVALAAAERFAGLVDKIRRESKPSHGNAIASEFRDRHTEAERELMTALHDFLQAARADLDVRSKLALPETSS